MKEYKVIHFWRVLALIPVLFVTWGCPDPDPVDEKQKEEQEKIAADAQYAAKSFLRSQYMDVYYYWRDEVIDRNKTLKPYLYDIYDFFDQMLYKDDRWSWMCNRDEYISEETGVVYGTWGVSFGQPWKFYGDYGIRVRYIYPGSPLEPFGVTRGAWLTHINNYDMSVIYTQEDLNYFNLNINKTPLNFTFRLVDGRDTTFTASMAPSLATNTALITRVFQPEDFPGLTEPVGYFHYLAFKKGFLNDISTAMETLHDAGVKKAIIDLRYNGGGDSDASDLLMGYLAPATANNKPYVIRRHNKYLASWDAYYSDDNNTYYVRRQAKALDLDEIYFIVGRGSASASEMVINGLKPYMGDRLQMVGDTTYGKPNGMYVLMYPGKNEDYAAYNKGDFSRLQWVFLPISFFNQNARSESIPWDGFVPNSLRPDDIYHDFGPEEDLIRACLSRIVNGSYPSVNMNSASSIKTKVSPGKGYQIEREEDRPGYGRYVAEPPVIFGNN